MRRACSAVATGLLVSAAALPAVLLSGLASAAASPTSPAKPASAARSGQPSGPVSVAITGLSPQWAAPGKTITVTGTVTNKTRQAISHLTVQLWSGSSPITDPAILQTDLTTQTGPLGDTLLAGRRRQLAGALSPGQAGTWQITVKVAELGMTASGVYPLTAEVGSTAGSASYANTFLPYLPRNHGRHASPSPARQEIAWVWPLLDQPLIALPGQSVCTSQPAQAQALGRSLAADGRLGGLLSAGARYTSQDKLTWAVDPALLWDAARIGRCADRPALARSANDWLARLRTVTRHQQLFVTPYANVNLALIRQGHLADVTSAFGVGRTVAGQILRRDLTPPDVSTGLQASSMAWPPGGIASSDILQSLVAKSEIQTVLLTSSAVPGAPSSVFLAPANGSYLRVLLYQEAMTTLLGVIGATQGSQFATAQGFLAETAVVAGPHPGQPIVVAPPQTWQAAPELAAAVLRETASAPWLRPVSLAFLARSARTSLQLPASAAVPAGFSAAALRPLQLVRQDIAQLQSIEVASGVASDGLRQALAALESSAWSARRVSRHERHEQLARITHLEQYVVSQQKKVVIGVSPRVTLGGLKGTVPVLIDNGLSYAIRVRLGVSYSQPPGGGSLDVHQQPDGTVRVRAHQRLVVKLHVQASQVGSTTIFLRLFSPGGRGWQLPYATAAVTVQATQFGMVAMIILAAALGVFMIGSAARAIRRRPAPPDNLPDGGQGEPDGPHDGQQAAEPDSVVPEHAELGTAGKSGL